MRKQRKRDVVAATIAIILVCLAMAFLSGCTEAEQSPKQWGQGDPPVVWQETFGNENLARLNYVQSKIIDALAQRVRVLEINQGTGCPVEHWLSVHTAYDPNGI